LGIAVAAPSGFGRRRQACPQQLVELLLIEHPAVGIHDVNVPTFPGQSRALATAIAALI
jgi:hypothetical protein